MPIFDGLTTRNPKAIAKLLLLALPLLTSLSYGNELENFEKQVEEPDKKTISSTSSSDPIGESLFLLFIQALPWSVYASEPPASKEQLLWFENLHISLTAGFVHNTPNINGRLVDARISHRYFGFWTYWDQLVQPDFVLTSVSNRFVLNLVPKKFIFPSFTIGVRRLSGKTSQDGFEIGAPVRFGYSGRWGVELRLFHTFFSHSGLLDVAYLLTYRDNNLLISAGYQIKLVGSADLRGPLIQTGIEF